MRYYCVLATLAFTGAVWAQEQSRQYVTYGYDVNGRRVATRSQTEGAAGSGTSAAERIRSLNGNTVPAETIEERVLSEGPNGRVVERIVERYDQQGRPAETERVRVEEEVRSGGETVVIESVYRTDLNGSSALQERSTTRSTKSGETTNTVKETQRPGLSGGFRVVERQTSVETARDDGLTRTTSTWGLDATGGFSELQREATEVRISGNRETETTTVYSARGGDLQFAEQVVTDTVKRSDGSETSEVSIYGASGYGRSITGAGDQPVLREQQLIERVPGADGSMTERVQYRSVSLSDPGRMEPYRLVREVVCTGACQEQEEAATQEIAQADTEPAPVESEEDPSQP